jgi:hypothetical protein
MVFSQSLPDLIAGRIHTTALPNAPEGFGNIPPGGQCSFANRLTPAG